MIAPFALFEMASLTDHQQSEWHTQTPAMCAADSATPPIVDCRSIENAALFDRLVSPGAQRKLDSLDSSDSWTATFVLASCPRIERMNRTNQEDRAELNEEPQTVVARPPDVIVGL